MARWLETLRNQYRDQAKTVAYLSAEFLLGPQLENSLLAADLDGIAAGGAGSPGHRHRRSCATAEVEPGLGNGGLGRLAACFIDSLATMNVPSIGYGIRYEYGIFRQTFVDGKQVEKPDNWLRLGSPWEIPHPENAVEVDFGGHTETYDDGRRRRAPAWVPGWRVIGVPYNYMVPGYRNGRVNTLRLWSARATQAFDLQIFNAGDYAEAVRAQTFAENISKVLYPEDSTPQGKELRLQQQYFFVACSLRDFLDKVLPADFDLHEPARPHHLPAQRHPPRHRGPRAHAAPRRRARLGLGQGLGRHAEGLRVHVPHAAARGARGVVGRPLGRLLPRHLEIIYRINERVHGRGARGVPRRRAAGAPHVDHRGVPGARRAHGAPGHRRGLEGQRRRGAALAAARGQGARTTSRDCGPDKFTNVTNGVTPRRFVRLANPGLSELITEAIGDGWVTDLERLKDLEPLADDAEFRRAFREVKAREQAAAGRRAGAARRDRRRPATRMLDAMVKRLHEYKRQSLKLLHIVSLYEG